MGNVRRLEVGNTTEVGHAMFQGGPYVGAEYIKPSDSEGWLLFAGDPADERPCVLRVDSIEEEVGHCTVMRKLNQCAPALAGGASMLRQITVKDGDGQDNYVVVEHGEGAVSFYLSTGERLSLESANRFEDPETTESYYPENEADIEWLVGQPGS